jgi:DNA-directed RNA polymerase alpha subunit
MLGPEKFAQSMPGYQPNSSQKISLDPVFNSVTKVNYSLVKNVASHASVEAEQEGPFPDTQILVLEIWTNGSISPRKALNFALNKLISFFYNIKTIKLFDSTLRSNKTYSKMINVWGNVSLPKPSTD